MAKILVGYYGDDPYDHDSHVSEWGRTVLRDDEHEKVLIDKYTEQLGELFASKRLCWYHVFLIDLSPQGATSSSIVSKYAPLKQRIVLNEAAKEDMLKAKTKRKSFDEVVVDMVNLAAAPPPVMPAAFFAPQGGAVGVGNQINMWYDEAPNP